MSGSGIGTLDHSVQTVNEWLNELCDRVDWSDKKRAYRLFRATLHALRDWLIVDEAADFGAQLPILVRGIYYEGWNPSATPVHPRRKSDLVERIQQEFAADPLSDPDAAIAAVFALLTKHLSGGEIRQVRNAMEENIRALWPVE